MAVYTTTPRAKPPSLPVAMRSTKAFYTAFRWGAGGQLLSLPFIAYEAANADRGEMLASTSGSVSGLMSYPILSGVIAGGLALIPGIGVTAAAVMGAIAAIYPSGQVDKLASQGFRMLNNMGRNVRHLEFGGNYQDSETAQRERQLAIQEMSAAFQTSRRYLGQEARIMHR